MNWRCSSDNPDRQEASELDTPPEGSRTTRRDRYQNFRMLRRSEPTSAFRIAVHRRPSPVAVIAPHGGKIERGTSAIAVAIAASDYCLYSFEGRKPARNRDLHITSTHFDEPRCLRLISVCDHVVAIHGCKGDEQLVYLGGRDLVLGIAIREYLHAAGIMTGNHDNPNLKGTDPNNICNRGRRRKGVQLEITSGLRSSLMAVGPYERTPSLAALSSAVRLAINTIVGRDLGVREDLH